jgi:hypothetical protein
MALGCGLTSVKGNRGENYKKGTVGSPKTYKGKNYLSCCSISGCILVCL